MEHHTEVADVRAELAAVQVGVERELSLADGSEDVKRNRQRPFVAHDLGPKLRIVDTSCVFKKLLISALAQYHLGIENPSSMMNFRLYILLDQLEN